MVLKEETAPTPVERPSDGDQDVPGKDTNSRGRHGNPQRTVIVMLVGLLLGVLAAVGHHLWYNHWNHKAVETASWSQTWIKNFGTAFAFLVKMFLAIVTSTAFVQQFWITVKAKPVAIGEVDSMFTVLQSALQFLSVRIWMKNPILALLAIFTWLLPLAAVVTPGTLNVVSVSTTPVVRYPVPQFDFVNKSASFGNHANNGGKALGASPRLQSLSMSAASSLQISQIQFPFANSSYDLEYFAPAVLCSTAPPDIITRVTRWLEDLSQTATSSSWLSFVPYNLNYLPANYTPFNTNECGGSSIYGNGYNFNFANQSASIVVAMNNGGSTFSTYPIVQCTLYNASYQVDFQSKFPSQNISILQRTLHSAVVTAGPGSQNASFGTPQWAYLNIMDAYANILLGYTMGSGGAVISYRTNYQVTALGNFSYGFNSETLSFVLESIFQNITLNLLSDSSFQQNRTTALLVPVTVDATRNVYEYRSTELYLAYGLSILAATSCLVLGLILIRRNAGSYSNDFSTVLRTTRHPSLRETVDTAQSVGLSPLSKELAEVKIVMMESDGDLYIPAGFRVARELGEETKLVNSARRASEDHLYHPV